MEKPPSSKRGLPIMACELHIDFLFPLPRIELESLGIMDAINMDAINEQYANVHFRSNFNAFA